MNPIFTMTLLAALLCSANVLQADEPSDPMANPERMPAFSWDRVPLYVHIRKDTAFTDEEIRYLATFPLITFEKATGHRDSGSVEAGTLKAARAVKAVNPDAKILYYRNVIVHYGGYAADTSLKSIPGANGTGVSLSCGGVTISVRIAWALHQLVVLRSTLQFSFFLAARTVADGQLGNDFKQVVPLLIPS
ncbi:hypothetical protein CA13_61960 [Planctomycetes bacterium CA13]|uniref:Uncharacterized protein n=1 Tax=Novipirellula herctigrandis TaxID=2527986 RepID=A0A5C5ZC44_9BACT|nr:hypothetical protein CA13_61960 [Planctomycetes bacterium CA13]